MIFNSNLILQIFNSDTIIKIYIKSFIIRFKKYILTLKNLIIKKYYLMIILFNIGCSYFHIKFINILVNYIKNIF